MLCKNEQGHCMTKLLFAFSWGTSEVVSNLSWKTPKAVNLYCPLIKKIRTQKCNERCCMIMAPSVT